MNNYYENEIRLNTSRNWVTTIDSHTEGEATRLIVDGIGPVPGDTMIEKLDWFKFRYDHVRSLLTKEPRGSREILAALVTQSPSPEAAFGLIYMDAKRYPYLCGHATIGAVVTLAKTGYLSLGEGENTVRVDTPSGVMAASVGVSEGQVSRVAISMVPSFVYKTDQVIDVDGFGPVPVDLVCTGGFFAMVDAQRIGITPNLENKDRLIDLGMKIIEAANDQLSVEHPLRPDVNTIDVTEFYDSDHNREDPQGSGMVIYGESHADRSPCGTGTAAKLALLHHCGRLEMDQPYTNFSPLGTSFDARLIKKERIGPYEGVVTRISGMAYITGIHHFVAEDHDPFQQGYMM